MRKKEFRSVFQFLMDNGQIKENHVIDKDLLKSLFQESDIKSWNYMNPLLTLKKRIQSFGLSSQTKDGNLIIFSRDQNHQIQKKKRFQKSFRLQDDGGEVLMNTDLNRISNDKDRQKTIHMINIYLTLRKGRPNDFDVHDIRTHGLRIA